MCSNEKNRKVCKVQHIKGKIHINTSQRSVEKKIAKRIKTSTKSFFQTDEVYEFARESVNSDNSLAIKQSLKEVKATTEKPNDFFASVFVVEKLGMFFHWNSFFIGDSGEVVPEIEVAVKEVMEQTVKK